MKARGFVLLAALTGGVLVFFWLSNGSPSQTVDTPPAPAVNFFQPAEQPGDIKSGNVFIAGAVCMVAMNP